MSWLDRLRPASFADVPFFVDSHEFETGRRHVQHLLPQRDRPLVEDLGRAPRTFQVRGYLLGDDYDLDRQRLMDAVEKRAPGFPQKVGRPLVHPYLGELLVFCSSLRVRESSRDGAMCVVSLDFVEVSETVIPARKLSATGAADSVGEEVGDAAAGEAEDAIAHEGVPEEVRLATSEAIAELGSFLASLDVFRGVGQDVEAFADAVAQLIGNAAGLATAPATLVSVVRSAIEGIFDAAGSALGAFEAYRTLFGYGGPAPGTGQSSNGKAAAANTLAVRNLALQLAGAGATRAAVRVDWESLDDATTARGQVLEHLDELAACSGDDVCRLVPELVAVVTTSVPRPAEKLPRTRIVRLAEWEPALLTSQRLYGSRARADEFARRNGVPRPGFLPALVPLEALVP